MQLHQEQPWKVSLWSCFDDMRVCCYGCWCCCCLYGENASKIDNRATCMEHGCKYTLMSLFGCCCVLHAGKRELLRQKYNLEEDILGDCFITCCCPSCSICQEAREIKSRGCLPPPTIVIRQPTLSISSGADADLNKF